jgi:hypothetical protein
MSPNLLDALHERDEFAGEKVMALWHCTAGGTKYGPITHEVLRQWLSEGRVRPADLVWTEGMANWQPASSVADLITGIDLTASAAPAPAPGAWPAGGAAPSSAGPMAGAQAADATPGASPATFSAPVYPQQAYYPVSRPSAPGAVASMVCGIIGVVVGCTGLILGIVAIYQARKAREIIALNPGRYDGAGMATAGFVLGIIAIVVGVFGLLWAIVWFGAMGTMMSHGFR